MKKPILGTLLTVTLLAGCATPNDLRQKKNALELTSTKSAKPVAMCIADKWENGSSFGVIPVSMRETEGGYAVAMTCNSDTCFLADISSIPPNLSKTVIYTGTVIGFGDYLDRVKSCQ